VSERPPEIVDNHQLYEHEAALRYISAQSEAPLHIATGYVALGGLLSLARAYGRQPDEARQVHDLFRETLESLRRERDFDAFPPSRRTEALEAVEALLKSDRIDVRRLTRRFLHGKAYIFATPAQDGGAAGPGAVLVTSANLTSGGLRENLELGLVSYQPGIVSQSVDWFNDLWEQSSDYRDRLLDLLFPPAASYDPETIFMRALLDLYGDEIAKEMERGIPAGHGFELTRFQQDGYRRARRILEQYGGVLYADGVGTGKTEIGLSFLTEYATEQGFYTLVVASAQLRDDKWHRRIAEANLPAQVVSYSELAADDQLVRADRSGRDVLRLNKDAYRLVVIDEAHAFRNPDTTWYFALDRLLGGTRKDLVLLTATPVNNSLWDLYHLILLFARHDAAFADQERPRVSSLRRFFLEAGAADPDAISAERLFPLVDALTVRRDRGFLERHYPNERFADGTVVRFPKPRLDERRYDLDEVYPGVFPAVVAAIDALTMARYRPDAYLKRNPESFAREEALTGLLRSQLLKRFESSAWAAITTLRMMIRAHEVFVEAWQADKVPSLQDVRDLASQAGEAESLPELVADALEGDAATRPVDDYESRFIEEVTADLERLRELEDRMERLMSLPDPKINALADILSSTPAEKVAVFTTYADTAHHIAQAIEADPARFGGRTMSVVIGTEQDPEERTRELARFAPKTVRGDDYEPPEGEVDLLIATDVLSEGQDLQQAQAVVSFDFPWNPQRVVQRNGRVIRLKSPHTEALLYTLLPERGDLEEALRLEARVRGKIAAANAAVGMETQVLQDVDIESRVFTDLEDLASRIGYDESLLDEVEGETTGSFAGEEFRARLMRMLIEGEIDRYKALPWGIGSAFVGPMPGVFFACRTRKDNERYWRFVTADDEVVREELEMLRRIDPSGAPRADLPEGFDLETAWKKAADDIVAEHNARSDPKAYEQALPASQRWALQILRSPDLPDEERYARSDEALGAGRDQLVRRALSDIRRRMSDNEISMVQAADEIAKVVDDFGLRPVSTDIQPPAPITEEDLGVVCYQIVLPE
jgi:superfamily II DNA or RNA helicase